MSDSVHVSPDKWFYYHENHKFLNPSCLCALFQQHGEALHYTEAAIYLPLNGHYRGELVVECMKGCCRYLGKSLFPLKIACPYCNIIINMSILHQFFFFLSVLELILKLGCMSIIFIETYMGGYAWL